MVFGKVPRPGRAKTRLAPALGPDGAADLYRAFLDDVLALARSVVDTEVELWIPDPDPGSLSEHYGELPIRRQAGEDLGERMAGAFDAAFGEGAASALVLGSDHPTLPPAHLERGFAELEGADAVVGPTEDGGYWAVGLRSGAWPLGRGLFREIPWSTGEVLSATRRRSREIGLTLNELPAWYDVDRPEALDRTRRDAEPGSATARALRRMEPPIR